MRLRAAGDKSSIRKSITRVPETFGIRWLKCLEPDHYIYSGWCFCLRCVLWLNPSPYTSLRLGIGLPMKTRDPKL